MAYSKKEKARAIAMLADGKSYRNVKNATGIGISTLARWKKREPFRNAVEQARRELGDLAAEIIDRSGRKLLEKLDDPDYDWTVPELNRVFGTAGDKAVQLKRIEEPQKVEHTVGVISPEDLAERREQLRQRLLDEGPIMQPPTTLQ